MWFLEACTWMALGLSIALGRCFFTDDYRGAARLLIGSALSALCIGTIVRLAVTQSVISKGEYSGMALLFAGLGAALFMTVDWFKTHYEPRKHA